MVLTWAAGSGIAHADTHSVQGVDPCYAPGSSTTPGTAAGGGSPGHGPVSDGGAQVVTPYYGSGSPASADAAYSQLPTSMPGSASTSAPGTLAFTGSQPILLGIGGAALVTLGGALVGLSRRRALPEGSENEAP